MDKTALIHKVLSNTATEVEKKELEDWLLQSPENQTEFEDIKLLWETSNESPQHSMKNKVNDALNKIKTTMQSKRRRQANTKAVLALITIIILALAILYFLSKQNRRPSRDLMFSNETLANVITVLEKEYDVNIDLEDQTKDCAFTGSFYQAANIEVVLETIDNAMNTQHKFLNERHYQLVGSGCPK
ncbi:MAG: DUF4974 domain-containing protein [Bacteroidetes bacterium]|nr:DUF4974 domain-containing protein [Bacteroidota bacterium]